MQSAYSIPNIVLCIMSGLAIDRFGTSWSIVVFTIISIVGLALFALSAHNSSLWLAIIGRGIYGIGAEGQFIWFNTIISIWFYYGEISFACAMGGCISRFGSVMADIFGPLAYHKSGNSLAAPFWIGCAVNVFSFIFIAFVNWIDKQNANRRKKFKYIRRQSTIRSKSFIRHTRDMTIEERRASVEQSLLSDYQGSDNRNCLSPGAK